MFWLSQFRQTYFNRTAISMLMLGISSGMPFVLISTTLSVWLKETNVSLEVIGYISLISLAYAYKCVWSPLLDAWKIPFVQKMGQRKSWVVFSQSMIGCFLILLACINPNLHLEALITVALVVAILSATQDVAIDAYRLEIAQVKLQASLAASYTAGFRMAILLGSMLPLWMVHRLDTTFDGSSFSPWTVPYVFFGFLMMLGAVITWFFLINPPECRDETVVFTGSKYPWYRQLIALAVFVILLFAIMGFFGQLVFKGHLFRWLFEANNLTTFFLEDLSVRRVLLYGVLIGLCLSLPGQKALAPIFVLGSPLYMLLSIFVLTVLLVSIPGFFTQIYKSNWWLFLWGEQDHLALMSNSHFRRAACYGILVMIGISSLGRRCLIPVLIPVSDFMTRYRWQAILLLSLIATYRLSDNVMSVISQVFFLDIGLNKNELAQVNGLAMIMSLLGAFLGGYLTPRLGLLSMLMIGGLSSAATNMLFVALSANAISLNWPLIIMTISVDQISAGLATVAFVAFLSAMTNLKFSASQYAFLSSVMLLLPRLLGGYSGKLVEDLGYTNFFWVTVALGIPALIFLGLCWFLRMALFKRI